MQLLRLITLDYKRYYIKKNGVVFNFISILMNPGFLSVFSYRIAHALYNFFPPLSIFSKLILLWVRILFGVEMHYKTKIGEGFKIYHGVGVVIGSHVIIGKNVTIAHGVTLGGNFGETRIINGVPQKYPVLEDGAYIACGAKIIRPVLIGKNSIIGANSVVTTDIPPNTIAVGMPAKVIKAADKLSGSRNHRDD